MSDIGRPAPSGSGWFQTYGSLVPFIAIVTAVAFVGGSFPPDQWYEGLAKPSYNPPNWVFPVAWSILFLMIGIAGWLVWRASGMSKALVVWGIGLIANMAWSAIFFGMNRLDLAFYELVVLWLFIAAFIAMAYKHSRLASLLFVPYLAWVSFAGLLNWTIWAMNPGA